MTIATFAAAPALIAVAPSAATTTTAAAGTRTIFAWPSDIDGQGPPLEFLAVEHFDGFIGFINTGEFDESETAGLAREFIEHEVD
jgi:hypothetical protein